MNQVKILFLSIFLALAMNVPVYAQEDDAAAGSEPAVAQTEPVAETATETPASTAVSYQVDAVHSTLGFAVKHLAVGTTRGGFSTYEGSITFDPNDYSSFEAIVTIDANSIDTNNEGRDKHLKSPEFFDTEKFPEIKFYSTRLEKRGEGTVIIGDLTMKGVTKELTIPVELSGPVNSPFGTTVIGLTAQIKINRQDFGISFSKTMDNGGLMVADMVDIIIEIEADHKG